MTRTRNVGLKQICEDTLELTIDKKSEDTFSDWNQYPYTTAQVVYGALDVIVPLHVYVKTAGMLDLTQRLRIEDIEEDKLVDVVPRDGSIICMTSRAATAVILPSAPTESPTGINPNLVQSGDGTVLVRIEELYSPSLLVPLFC